MVDVLAAGSVFCIYQRIKIECLHSISSFLPPSTQGLGHRHRTNRAVYRPVISFSNTKRNGETVVIVQHLLATLNKLKHWPSIVLKENAMYEVRPRYHLISVLCSVTCSFRSGVNSPLRGINEVRCFFGSYHFRRSLARSHSQILNLLSHLTSVLEHMEPAWAHAFLKWTWLSDMDFQSDILAVVSALPFLLPFFPLDKRTLDRFSSIFISNWKPTSPSHAVSTPQSVHGTPSWSQCRARRMRRRFWSTQNVDGGDAREFAVFVHSPSLALLLLFGVFDNQGGRIFCVGVSTVFSM